MARRWRSTGCGRARWSPCARALASARSDDKRLSAGCVVVPGSFYDAVVQPVLGAGRAVVYVLPEQIQAAALALSLQQL